MAGKEYLDTFLSDLVNTGPAGCGCAVARDGELLYENYFGYADLEKKKKITADSVTDSILRPRFLYAQEQ